MKRSQMLKLIRKTLEGRPIDHLNFEEQILSTVESLGMVPPVYISNPNQYNRSEGTYGFEVHEWEPEDDMP